MAFQPFEVISDPCFHIGGTSSIERFNNSGFHGAQDCIKSCIALSFDRLLNQ